MSLLLYVSVGGVTHPLEVEPMAAVRDLQNALQAALGRQPRQLSFQGRVLQPEALLADEGVCQESRLEELSRADPLFDTLHHGSNVSFPQRESGPLGREASRLRSYRLGLVLTAAPVAGPGMPDGGFMVMVTEQIVGWSGTVILGLISSSPAELCFDDYNSVGWRGLSGTCAFNTSSAKIEVGNVLLCRRTDGGMHAAVLSTEGAVLINRLFEMESELQSAVLYGFCDIYAKTQSVKLLWQTGCGPPPVPLPAPPPPPSSDAAARSGVSPGDVVVSLALGALPAPPSSDVTPPPPAPPPAPPSGAVTSAPSPSSDPAPAPPSAAPPAPPRSSSETLASPPSSRPEPPSSCEPLASTPSSGAASPSDPAPALPPSSGAASPSDPAPALPPSSGPAAAPPESAGAENRL